MMTCQLADVQKFREIVGVKWENNIIVGVKLRVIFDKTPQEVYKTLKELHDEHIQIQTEIKLGKLKSTDSPITTLRYTKEQDSGGVEKFVYIAKIGNQYEIRDVKDEVIPQALLEAEKI